MAPKKQRVRREQFAQVRKTAGYTQEKLAEALGIERGAPSRWETGAASPAVYLRPQIAKLLKMSEKQLNELLWPQGAGRSASNVREPGAEQQAQPASATPVSAAKPHEAAPPSEPQGHELASQPRGGMLLPVMVNRQLVLMPVDADAVETSGLGALVGKQTSLAWATFGDGDDETRRAAPAMEGLPVFSGPSDELVTLLVASLALFGAVTSGLAAQGNEAHDQLDIWRCLVDAMKRRGLLQLLGQVAAGGTLASPAAGGLQLLGLGDLNPDEQERVTQAIASPERVDEQVLGHVEQVLWAAKLNDDKLGPQAAFHTVLGQCGVLQSIRDECSVADELRPRLLSVLSNALRVAGWLSFNSNDLTNTQYYYEKARNVAHEAQDVELIAFILANMSDVATGTGKPHIGLDYALAAQAWAVKTVNLPLRAFVSDVVACAWASIGDESQCMRELEHADGYVASLAGQQFPTFYHYTPALHAARRGRCLLQIGHINEAVTIINESLTLSTPTAARDIALRKLNLGKARIQSKEIEEAAAVIGDAAELATTNRSARLVKELYAVRAGMQPWQDAKSVKDLDERLIGTGLR
jgi:transcriptional regulator with XRE-family HTH domain